MWRPSAQFVIAGDIDAGFCISMPIVLIGAGESTASDSESTNRLSVIALKDLAIP
jgi:hypothetical protein